MDAADETMCWCASAEGLLRALIPYAIRSFNDDADDARRLFADHGIVDVGAALSFHDGAIIIVEAEREAARRIVAGVTTQADADKLIVSWARSSSRGRFDAAHVDPATQRKREARRTSRQK